MQILLTANIYKCNSISQASNQEIQQLRDRTQAGVTVRAL